MFQRCDSKPKSTSCHAVPGWLEPSDRQIQAAAVLGCAKSFQATHCRPTWGSGSANSGPDHRFDTAVELYEGGDWRDAFVAAVGLANTGHAAAAHLALLMLRYGARLYGIALQAEPRQVAQWAQLVLRAKAVERRQVKPAAQSHRCTERRSMTAVS